MKIQKNEWKDPRTMVGGTAEGADYFPRVAVEGRLWKEIGKGNHINFTAPRRVGKSSVMKYMAKNPEAGFLCCYQNISSDSTAQEFYKRLFELVISQATDSKWKRIKEWTKSIGIEEISLSGSVKFKEKVTDYKETLMGLLGQIKDEGARIVLFLDEFPDVIKNISVSTSEGKAIAKDVLQTLRSIRHDDRFKGHFTMVLAGSVGLAHIVSDIDRLAVINDLNEQHLPALMHSREFNAKTTEAEKFVEHLMEGATMQIDLECRAYLLTKLGQPMPYYIQLMIEACNESLREAARANLLPADIDRAWDKILKEHKYFADWDERLRDYFPKVYPYFLDVLSKCADQGKISIQEAFDIAKKHGVGTEYKGKLDDVLAQDGYLYEESMVYRFHSPLLQAWWKNRHPVLTKKKK
jgi:uncharacterized protein